MQIGNVIDGRLIRAVIDWLEGHLGRHKDSLTKGQVQLLMMIDIRVMNHAQRIPLGWQIQLRRIARWKKTMGHHGGRIEAVPWRRRWRHHGKHGRPIERRQRVKKRVRQWWQHGMGRSLDFLLTGLLVRMVTRHGKTGYRLTSMKVRQVSSIRTIGAHWPRLMGWPKSGQAVVFKHGMHVLWHGMGHVMHVLWQLVGCACGQFPEGALAWHVRRSCDSSKERMQT